jgi:hypothetical protein
MNVGRGGSKPTHSTKGGLLPKSHHTNCSGARLKLSLKILLYLYQAPGAMDIGDTWCKGRRELRSASTEHDAKGGRQVEA